MTKISIPSPPLILSLVGIILGSTLGVALIPDQVNAVASLRWAAASMALGLIISPLSIAIKKPIALLHPVSLLLVGLVYWLLIDLIQARYLLEISDTNAARLSFVCIALFALGIVLAAARFPPPLPVALRNAAMVNLGPTLIFRIGVFAFILSFLRFAVPADFNVFRIYEALFLPRFSAPWARGALGGWDSFLDHLSYFGYLLPSLTVLMYRVESKVSFRVALLALMAVLIALLLAQGGGRRIVGALALAAGLTWVITARYQGRALLGLSLFGIPAILMYLQYVLVTRSLGIGGAGEISTKDLFSEGIAVDDNINRLSQLVEIIPSQVPHVGFDWVYLILVRPIPRAFWPGKPEGLDFSLPEFLGMEGVSLTASVVGESYMAFGFFGCLITGLLYGYLSRRLLKVLDYSAYVGALQMYILGLIALFVGLRSAVDLVLFSYGFLAWIAVVYLFRGRQRLA